ncbi:Hsp70 protein-domain-containing protein [Mycena filopes]|nr:Hsp70 protein-domain-containing protein [Mycena filopes]
MPAEQEKVLTCCAFLLALAVYGLRTLASIHHRYGETGQSQPPFKWGPTGPIIGIDVGTRFSRVGLITADGRVAISRDVRYSWHTDSITFVDGKMSGAGGFSFVIQNQAEANDSSDESIPCPKNGLSGDSRGCHGLYSGSVTFLDGIMRVNCSSHVLWLSMPEYRSGGHQPLPVDNGNPERVDSLAAVFREVRATAEQFYASRISQAVITVPSNYDEQQRQWVRRAALLAGLAPIRLLDESVAVAVAYGLDTLPGESYAFVLDVGSSSTRASLLHIADGDIELLSSVQNDDDDNDSDTLGADAFDRPLLAHAMEALKGEPLDEVQTLVLRDQVERAKIRLSFEDDAVLALPGPNKTWLLSHTSAAYFTSLIADVAETIVDWAVDQTFARAGLPRRITTHVILAGGGAYIPILQARTAAKFPGLTPLSADESHPDDAVVYGATMFGRRLALGLVREEDKLIVQSVTPLAFLIQTADGSLATLIAAHSPLPATGTQRLNVTDRMIQIVTSARPAAPDLPEFIGRITLPSDMSPTNLQVTLEFSTYGVLNVTAVDPLGNWHSALIEPRRPYQTEIDESEVHTADRDDLKLRMELFRAHVTHALPILQRQLHRTSRSHPQHGVRSQLVRAIAGLEVWIHEEMLSASREEFLGKLRELELLLREDIQLGVAVASDRTASSRFWRWRLPGAL